MALDRSVIRVTARGNDIKRKLLDGKNKRCFLLKRAGETKRFTVVLELMKGWLMEYNNYREQMVLGYATLDASFSDQMAQASHVAYGNPAGAGGNELDVYVTDPSRRDVIPPTAEDSQWKCFLVREPMERFTITT